MKLTYENYILVSEGESDRFDLYKNVVVEVKNKGIKTGETKATDKLLGYAYTLGGVINRIALDCSKDNLFDIEELERLMSAILGTIELVGVELSSQIKELRAIKLKK